MVIFGDKSRSLRHGEMQREKKHKLDVSLVIIVLDGSRVTRDLFPQPATLHVNPPCELDDRGRGYRSRRVLYTTSRRDSYLPFAKLSHNPDGPKNSDERE